MLPRTPEHHDLMNEAQQAKAYAEADFNQPHQAFVNDLLTRHAQTKPSMRLLDLGCGPADISIRLLQQRPHWIINGLDGAPAMLHYGRQRAARLGLGERLKLYDAYLPLSQAWRWQGHDMIISNSLLHHMHDPADFWRCIRQLAAPGCRLYLMDLLRPDSAAQCEALVRRYATHEPALLQHDFHASLHAAYTLNEVGAQLQEHGLHQLHAEQISDRHWLISSTGFTPLT